MPRPYATIACAALAVLAGACGARPEGDGPAPSWQEFLAITPQTASGGYLVHEDVKIFGRARLRAYYDRYVAPALPRSAPGDENVSTSRAELKVDLVGGADNVWPHAQILTYCVDSAFGTRRTAISAAMKLATQSWSQRLNVQFVEVSPSLAPCRGLLLSLNTTAVIEVGPLAPRPLAPIASAFWPHEPLYSEEDGTFAHILEVSDTPFTSTDEDDELEGVLRHELGHILGFRHEDTDVVWGSFSCSGVDDRPFREVAEPSTSPDPTASAIYDENSVMMPPRCWARPAGPPRQSELDYAGGVRLYGLAPALVSTVL